MFYICINKKSNTNKHLKIQIMFNFELSNNRSEYVGTKYSFETKKEANKALRGFIKLHDMERHAGYIVNYRTGMEIHKQY